MDKVTISWIWRKKLTYEKQDEVSQVSQVSRGLAGWNKFLDKGGTPCFFIFNPRMIRISVQDPRKGKCLGCELNQLFKKGKCLASKQDLNIVSTLRKKVLQMDIDGLKQRRLVDEE